MKTRLTLLAASAVLVIGAAVPPPGSAQTSGIGVVTTLSGRATVERMSLPQPQPLRFRDAVFVEDRISTGEKSIVRVLLGGKALVTVRELSVLTITEEPARARINLESGKIALAVAQQRMKPGEVIEIQAGNAVAAVRGTVVVAETIATTAPTANLHVVHGLVDVFQRNMPAAPSLSVGTLQSFIGTPGGFGQLRALTPAAAQALFADLVSDPEFSQASDDFLVDMAAREQGRATALARFLSQFIDGGRDPGASPANNGITACTIGTCPVSGTGTSGGDGDSGGATKSGKALTTYKNQTVDVEEGSFYSVPKNGNVSLAQPLLETTATRLTVAGDLVDVKGTLSAGDPSNPFIFLDPTTFTAMNLLSVSGGGGMTAAATFFQDLKGAVTLTGDALFVSGNSSLSGNGAAGFLALDGSTMTVAGQILAETGAQSTATLKGALLSERNGAAVTAQSLASVNAALLDASAPLLTLFGNSTFTSTVDAVALASVNAATRLSSVASLNAGVMTIKSGAGLNVTGGSTATVTGDLFSLANRSVLTILNGPLLSLGGNSNLTITGALLNFIGVGNTVSITNSLCAGPCPIIAGIPVFITGGATVSITGAIKNAAGNTIRYSSPSAALVAVNGGKTTLTVLGK